MDFQLIPAPYGSVLFCDDIREEVGSKTTLVGCYGADIVIGEVLPTSLPKFGMCCRLVFDKFTEKKTAVIIVAMPDETVSTAAFRVPLELDPETLTQKGLIASDPENPRYLITCNIIGGPFAFANEGLIQVFLQDDALPIRIGVIRVRSTPKSS